MNVYIDGNIVVAIFIPDELTEQATALMAALSSPIVISDGVALEFASTVARKVRDNQLTTRDGRAALANFDRWAPVASRLQTNAADFVTADAIVRRFEINLHGADAVHVALILRAGAALLTLDDKMGKNAKKLGVTVI